MSKKRNKIKLGKITADAMAIKHQRDLAMPTIFEALQEAGGITIRSDLKNIEIIRRISISNGGGRKKTN